MTIAAPNFAIRSGNSVVRLYCKSCGAVIADIVRNRFRHLNNYTELTIRFEDGSFHIVNGCADCLTMDTPVELLHELYQADMAFDPGSYRPRDMQRTVQGVERVMHLDELR